MREHACGSLATETSVRVCVQFLIPSFLLPGESEREEMAEPRDWWFWPQNPYVFLDCILLSNWLASLCAIVDSSA